MPAVLDFLARRGDEVRPLLDHAPQTNEVGRSAALVGGLLRLADRWRLPVRLFEIGSSGGLNLQADRFRITDGAGGGWGDPASPVLLDRAWAGEPLPPAAPLEVVARSGSDLQPVDVTTEDGRLTLTSYVWPDMTERHARLAGAIELAREPPVVVERADAASYVERLEVVPGTLTVLWHSVMWQYVPHDQQAEGDRATGRARSDGDAGRAAGPSLRRADPAYPRGRAPVLGVCRDLAWSRRGARGERTFLGRMAPHGVPVTWE